MSLDQLLVDINKERERLESAGFADTKRELCGNVYPMLADLIENVRDELAEVHDVVVEYFEGVESVIQADLAQKIVGTLQLGLQAIKTQDDVDVAAFTVAVDVLIPEVKQASLEEEEEDDQEVEGTDD